MTRFVGLSTIAGGSPPERVTLSLATPISAGGTSGSNHREPSTSNHLAVKTKDWCELEEKKRCAEIRVKQLEDKLQQVELERAALQSDMAVLGVQMGALEAAKDEQREELCREKAAAAEALAALEATRQEKVAAVEEREFTIEAQAGMLQQLSSELERAERCREDAERSKASHEDKLAKLQSELDRCAKELATRQNQLHQIQSASDIMCREGMGRMSLDSRMSLGSVHGGNMSESEEVRAAESVARQSQERLLELIAARQSAEREANEARAAAAKWESEVSERRAELELMQEELEGCLEEERSERRKAEEEYAKVREERDGLERLVEIRAEEIGALEERLLEATAAADEIRAACEERDTLLQEGAAMLEAKEAELNEAAEYAFKLQAQLEQLSAETKEPAGLRALPPAGSPGSREHIETREKSIRELKANNEAAAAAAANEVATLRRNLEQRDAALKDAASQLIALETECSTLARELADRGATLTPLRKDLQAAQSTLAAMREEIDLRDVQLNQNAELLRKSMSAEKRQTAAVQRLEMSLNEREEMVRNMDEQLQAVDAAAKEDAAAAAKERAALCSRLSESQCALKTLEAKLAAATDNHASRLASVEEEKAAAIMRAEALAAEVADDERQRSSLARAAEAAAQTAALERQRRESMAAEAEEALAQCKAANVEVVAELEGRILQIQGEAEAVVDEAEERVKWAEKRLQEAETALAVSQNELVRYRDKLAAAQDDLRTSNDSKNSDIEKLQEEAESAKRSLAEAENRYMEAHHARTKAEAQCTQLEAQLTAAIEQVAAGKEEMEQSLAAAAKLQLQRDDEAAAACAVFEAKVAAAESVAEAGASEVDKLSAVIAELRGEVTLQTNRADDFECKARCLTDELAVAVESASEAREDADEARNKAKETEKESLFFLGEMQVAVADAEKKIVALHKTVASRDMKLAQMTAEVKALKNAVRRREEQLETAEKDAKAKLEMELKTLKKAHAEDIESAKGEVEGQSALLQMEMEQLRLNLDEKRSKITRLQAELSRATEKNQQLRDQMERARAAQAVAEERAEEAEVQRGNLADAMSRAEEASERNSAATKQIHQLQLEELQEELNAAKGRATVLGRAMWENGMRPHDLESDAASALEEVVGMSISAFTPQSKAIESTPSTCQIRHVETTPTSTFLAINSQSEGDAHEFSISKKPVKESLRETTVAAGQISISKLQAGVEARKAARRRSSMGLGATSPELVSLRKSLVGLVQKASAAPPPVTLTPSSVSRATNTGKQSSAVKVKLPRHATLTSKSVDLSADIENAPPSGASSKTSLALPSAKELKSRMSGSSEGGRASFERVGLKATRMATRRKALRALQSHSIGTSSG